MPKEMALSKASSVSLKHSGLSMPVIALGVYQSQSALQSCKWALEAGYRHVDSARVYRNEKQVIDAARQSGIARTDLFLTTKIAGKEHGASLTAKALRESVDIAGDLKWDLVLLHDPTAGKTKRLEAWKVLQQGQKDGKIRAIGVSNYNVHHLEEIKNEAGGGVDVNQIELHPFCQQTEIVDYCRKEGIVIQAYCPIVRNQRSDNPVLVEIAKALGKSPTQILIRWSLQHGFVPLPKSDNQGRIKDNLDVFSWTIDDANMQKLNALDEGKKGACSWNPVDRP